MREDTLFQNYIIKSHYKSVVQQFISETLIFVSETVKKSNVINDQCNVFFRKLYRMCLYSDVEVVMKTYLNALLS